MFLTFLERVSSFSLRYNPVTFCFPPWRSLQQSILFYGYGCCSLTLTQVLTRACFGDTVYRLCMYAFFLVVLRLLKPKEIIYIYIPATSNPSGQRRRGHIPVSHLCNIYVHVVKRTELNITFKSYLFSAAFPSLVLLPLFLKSCQN